MAWFHVGEDVDDFLTGLRHIDEVVSLLLPKNQEGCRLGHALIGRFESYADLPYEALNEAGIAMSLNTDDPGLFMTTLPGELEAMYGAMAGERSHREILSWLRERVFDADQSTFLGRHVPAGSAAVELIDEHFKIP